MRGCEFSWRASFVYKNNRMTINTGTSSNLAGSSIQFPDIANRGPSFLRHAVYRGRRVFAAGEGGNGGVVEHPVAAALLHFGLLDPAVSADQEGHQRGAFELVAFGRCRIFGRAGVGIDDGGRLGA